MPSAAPAPLYLTLADKIEALIRASAFRGGERIPSVRTMGRQQSVSIATVLQAYRILEDRHLIESRPKSGYFVQLRPADAQPTDLYQRRRIQSRSLAKFPPLMSLVHDVVDPGFIPLGGAHPSAALLPTRKLASLMASIARLHPQDPVTCDPAPGCARLRTELSRRSLDWGCHLTPDDFLITNGATEALFLALSAVTRHGDTVMVESPTHYGILNALSQLHLNAVAIPSSPPQGMDLDAAAKVLAREKIAAIVVVPNFNNPLGGRLPDSARQRLATLAAMKDVPLIEDDVYGDLYFEGTRPSCLKSLDRTGNILLCGSFSKTLAPGYRVGYLAAGRHHDRIIPLKTALNYGNPPLPALTIAEFLRTGGYEHHLAKLRRTFHTQIQQTRAALLEVLPDKTRVSQPQGGFFLWLQLPASVDAMQLFHDARRSQLNIAPGHLFSPDAEFNNHLRISCTHPWTDRIAHGIKHLGKLVAQQMRGTFSKK
ncbi:MAG: gntR [Verrucomicrobiales bacterium]|nr:gntR [Verrucomicrobiales bacterium]